VGGAFHRLLGLGESLLRAATRQRQASKYGREGSGFQGIRILFRCWKEHKPYREDFYREALARHQQRASKRAPVQLQWKTCAGFSKIIAIPS